MFRTFLFPTTQKPNNNRQARKGLAVIVSKYLNGCQLAETNASVWCLVILY